MIGEAVVVLELFFESGEFGFQRGEENGVGRVVVDVVELFRILDQVVEFPLIFFPKMDELVSFGADTVVGAGIMVTRIMGIALLHAGAPVRRSFALE